MTVSIGKAGEQPTTLLDFEEENYKPYHSGKTWRPQKDGSKTPLETRPFIAWDGEGCKSGWSVSSNGDTVRQPQPYILLMAALPDGTEEFIRGKHLNTNEILKFIIDVEERFPDAFHVAFGFSYDVNQILSSLSKYQIQTIHKTGFVYINLRMYRLEWRKGKSLTVTRYYRDGRKTSVTIYDAFSFFHRSFVKSCELFIDKDHPDLEIVRKGKARRQEFKFEDLDNEIIPYTTLEVTLLVKLMDKFREILYGAGFKIRHWHGPGAIASLLLSQAGIREHMSDCPDSVREAAQYAYAAGRFEAFKTGYCGESIWSLDINSAYPEAIAQLPSLAKGKWVHVNEPTRLVHFGVYRITSTVSARSIFSKPGGPLFHRDKRHRISFPWLHNGWFWTPEAALVKHHSSFTIHEGWEWHPDNSHDRPFEFVREMFNKRRQWQAEGNKAEYALKLGLNSLYGKMAQRVGWNKKTMQSPTWHQLEWAGWVTSYTRAKIYKMMCQLGLETIIAVETDGIYTTRNPDSINITSANGLGEWKIEQYVSLVYLQSGLAWTKPVGDSWKFKYRGLDPNSLDIERVITHLSHLGTGIAWDSPQARITATTSRFVGAGAALASTQFETKFRRWETVPRQVVIGGDGKRLHLIDWCMPCRKGIPASEEMHDLVSCLPTGEMSTPHALPWLGNADAPWREDIENQAELDNV
jgi:hypothetical protein